MTFDFIPWHCLTARIAGRYRRIGNSGAVAIITAVAAPALLMIVGFACDYGYASYINQRLARATDSGTIGSVSQTAATTAGGYSQTAAMQAIGVSIFNANIADLSSSGVTFNLSVVADGTGGVIATGNYTYKVPTFFGGVLGLANIPLSGTAKTTARPLVYVNYYILVDASQSMGIGSTASDMSSLYNRVVSTQNADPGDTGCVFGCHMKQFLPNRNRYQNYTNEDLAHNLAFGPRLNLRIDAAVTAIQNIVNSANSVASVTQNIKFGLYTITIDPTTSKRVQVVVDPPSTNYSQVSSSASNIDLGNITSSTGTTDFHGEFGDFLSSLSPAMTQGSGASATSPLNYVFLITDGVSDVPGNCTIYGVCVNPLNPSDCDSLKANATVGVIYTTYSPIYQFNTPSNLEKRYGILVDPISNQILPSVQSCATSSDFFFKADDGPQLVSSMQALFARTQPVSARITQ